MTDWRQRRLKETLEILHALRPAASSTTTASFSD
jgi:hypothetical protein